MFRLIRPLTIFRSSALRSKTTKTTFRDFSHIFPSQKENSSYVELELRYDYSNSIFCRIVVERLWNTQSSTAALGRAQTSHCNNIMILNFSASDFWFGFFCWIRALCVQAELCPIGISTVFQFLCFWSFSFTPRISSFLLHMVKRPLIHQCQLLLVTAFLQASLSPSPSPASMISSTDQNNEMKKREMLSWIFPGTFHSPSQSDPSCGRDDLLLGNSTEEINFPVSAKIYDCTCERLLSQLHLFARVYYHWSKSHQTNTKICQLFNRFDVGFINKNIFIFFVTCSEGFALLIIRESNTQKKVFIGKKLTQSDRATTMAWKSPKRDNKRQVKKAKTFQTIEWFFIVAAENKRQFVFLFFEHFYAISAFSV